MNPAAAAEGLPFAATPRRRIAALVAAVGLRTGVFAATLLGAISLVQGLLAFAPGDAIDLLPNGDILRAGLEAEWGLDRPVGERILVSIGKVLQGDLGTSLTYRPGAPVLELVSRTATHSLGLLAPALLLSVVTALLLALHTAGRPSLSRRFVQCWSVVPTFLAAYLLVVGINEATWTLIQGGHISRPEWFALPDQPSALRAAIALVVLAWAGGGLTDLHAAFETEVRAVRGAPFIEAARARGANVRAHLALNLLVPTVSLSASRAAGALGAMVVTEKLLLLNGAGATLWQACLLRDYPLAMGITLAFAAIVCGARLMADILRIAIDPRLRVSA